MDYNIKSKALWLFQNGYNCTESILKATQDAYGLDENEEITNMCSILSNGMGIGCFCGAVLVGMMLIGRLLDPVTAKRFRIRLLWGFREEFPNYNCHALKNKSPNEGCEDVIAYICNTLEAIISDEQLVE